MKSHIAGAVAVLIALAPVAGRAAQVPRPAGDVWVITDVTVGVPKPPKGGLWDSAAGALGQALIKGTQGLRAILPDVRVCLESANVPLTCTETCVDAGWDKDSASYLCAQPVPSGVWLQTDLRVHVYEMDGEHVSQVIDNFRVDDASKCDPCEHAMDQQRRVWIQFEIQKLPYAGRFRATPAKLAPASIVPVAAAYSSGNVLPPPPVVAASPVPAPPATSTSEKIAAFFARAGIRDSAHCVGPDQFFKMPLSFGSQLINNQGYDEAFVRRRYHLWTLVNAIADEDLRARVKARISRKDPGFNDEDDQVNELIKQDAMSGQQLTEVRQHFIDQLVNGLLAKPLAELLPFKATVESLTADLQGSMWEKLTDTVLEKTVGDIFVSDGKITAECALNELSKEGFIALAGGLP